MSKKEKKIRRRIAMCLVQSAIADAYAAPYEFTPRSESVRAEELPDYMPVGCTFTDDTESFLAVMDSIIAKKGVVDPQSILDYQVKWWSELPHRGYGPSMVKTFNAAQRGEVNSHTSGLLVHPNGSYGNGALIRAIPIGLLWISDPFNVAGINEDVTKVLWPTHRHPDAVYSACLLANYIARSFSCSEIECLLSWSVHDLGRFDIPELFKIICMNNHNFSRKECDDSFLDSISRDDSFGSGFQIHSIDALATCFYINPSREIEFLDLVKKCVNVGGDTDTIACICAAMNALTTKYITVPGDWIKSFEINNHGFGLDYLCGVSEKFADIVVSRCPSFFRSEEET